MIQHKKLKDNFKKNLMLIQKKNIIVNKKI